MLFGEQQASLLRWMGAGYFDVDHGPADFVKVVAVSSQVVARWGAGEAEVLHKTQNENRFRQVFLQLTAVAEILL